MSIRCPVCGEENRDGALICDLCRTVFGRPGESPASPQTPRDTGAAQPEGMPRPILIVPAPVAAPNRAARVVGLLLGAGVLAGLVLGVRALSHRYARPVAVTRPAGVRPVWAPAAEPVAGATAPGVRPTMPTTPSSSEAPPPPGTPPPGAPPAAAEVAPAREAEPPVARPKRIVIPYRAYEGRARRVIIPVTLNGSLTVPMAVDTGAPGTMISVKVAERLGLFREDQGRLLVTASGIGGSTPVVLVVLDSVATGGARDQFVPATVTTEFSDAFEGLVGMDFMGNYSIGIDTEHRVVVLVERPAQELAPAGHDERWWREMFEVFGGQRAKWQRYRDDVDEHIRKSDITAGGQVEDTNRLRAFCDFQVNEADKLYVRLDRYASDNSVPRHWR